MTDKPSLLLWPLLAGLSSCSLPGKRRPPKSDHPGLTVGRRPAPSSHLSSWRLAPKILPLFFCLLAALTSPSSALASAPDAFGFGSRAISLGGAYTALSDDYTATFYNPAGLIDTSPMVTLGFFYVSSQLQINGTPQPLRSPVGLILGASAPIPFGGFLRDRFAVGVGIYLPPNTVLQEIGRMVPETFFPLYDNRIQRLVALPALAVRLWKGLSAGIGFNVFIGLNGDVQGIEGATRGIEASVNEELHLVLSWQAGLRYSHSSWLRLGLTFRQQFEMPFHTPLSTSLQGNNLELLIDTQGLYTPPELALGIALRPVPRLWWSLDLIYSWWSTYKGPYLSFHAVLPLDLPTGKIVADLFSNLPPLEFFDTFALRTGAEYRLRLSSSADLLFRLGYALETSPLPPQTGRTNMVDGFKHTVALGLSLDLQRLAKRPLSLDLHGQWIIVTDSLSFKDLSLLPDESSSPGLQTQNPGYPVLRGGGFLFTTGVALNIGF